mmetsp:Transcript_15532/g.43050  ORF Transcript_15532/g.43050 Transcript_15532/m.43050 type:complete len:112 (+) Transcript_15532:458-793(+)
MQSLPKRIFTILVVIFNNNMLDANLLDTNGPSKGMQVVIDDDKSSLWSISFFAIMPFQSSSSRWTKLSPVYSMVNSEESIQRQRQRQSHSGEAQNSHRTLGFVVRWKAHGK